MKPVWKIISHWLRTRNIESKVASKSTVTIRLNLNLYFLMIIHSAIPKRYSEIFA